MSIILPLAPLSFSVYRLRQMLEVPSLFSASFATTSGGSGNVLVVCCVGYCVEESLRLLFLLCIASFGAWLRLVAAPSTSSKMRSRVPRELDHQACRWFRGVYGFWDKNAKK